MRFIPRPQAMITCGGAGVVLEAKYIHEKEGNREKGVWSTRLIISIFHSCAPDEKERPRFTGDYKRPLLFLQPPHAARSALSVSFLFVFFFLVFPPPASRQISPLMVLSRIGTADTYRCVLQRFARGSIYQGFSDAARPAGDK